MNIVALILDKQCSQQCLSTQNQHSDCWDWLVFTSSCSSTSGTPSRPGCEIMLFEYINHQF